MHLRIIFSCIQVTVSWRDAGAPFAYVSCTIASSVAQPPVTTAFYIQTLSPPVTSGANMCEGQVQKASFVLMHQHSAQLGGCVCRTRKGFCVGQHHELCTVLGHAVIKSLVAVTACFFFVTTAVWVACSMARLGRSVISPKRIWQWSMLAVQRHLEGGGGGKKEGHASLRPLLLALLTGHSCQLYESCMLAGRYPVSLTGRALMAHSSAE